MTQPRFVPSGPKKRSPKPLQKPRGAANLQSSQKMSISRGCKRNQDAFSRFSRTQFATIWNAISGWLSVVGFSDFQRDVGLGSKLADRVVELRKKADLSRIFYILSRGYSLHAPIGQFIVLVCGSKHSRKWSCFWTVCIELNFFMMFCFWYSLSALFCNFQFKTLLDHNSLHIGKSKIGIVVIWATLPNEMMSEDVTNQVLFP